MITFSLNSIVVGSKIVLVGGEVNLHDVIGNTHRVNVDGFEGTVESIEHTFSGGSINYKLLMNSDVLDKLVSMGIPMPKHAWRVHETYVELA